LGFGFAFANCDLFMLYVALGHRVANTGSRDGSRWGGVDQLVMAGLRRAAFALMLSILPGCATVIGLLVLAQLPTVYALLGVALVIAAVAVHQQPTRHTDREETQCGTPV
jgi:inner membrane transporter RhtA